MIIKLIDDRRKVLGVSTGGICIGDSKSEFEASKEIGAILNVAQDFVLKHNWCDGLETMHVGLVDGPGNEESAYCAAVLALDALLHRHNTLICCHSGGRSLAVVLLYLMLETGNTSERLFELWRERLTSELPRIDSVHIAMIPNVLRRLQWLKRS